MKDQITSAALKTTPPGALVVWHYLLDLPVEKWVSVATLIYVLLQAFFLVRDKMKRRGRK